MSQALRPLVLSAKFGDEATPDFAERPCSFCGMGSGCWLPSAAATPVNGESRSGESGRGDDVTACALCFLCRHLERPFIDQEAVLAWLPEISQAALNVTMREIHIELFGLGEELYDSGRLHRDTPERAMLYHARSALGARGPAAANRLGTDRPSELASAFYRLSPAAYAHRAKLLDGVRLLPLGRFYDGGCDVYPAIVDSWRGPRKRRRPRVPASPVLLSAG
jgi:intracellular multiplication protein IcmJ